MPIIYLKDSGDFMAEAADAIAAAQIAEGGAKSARDEAEGYAASALDSKTAAAGSAQQAAEAADVANSAAQGERDRIAAEQRRVAAENDRTQTEQARVDAENTRLAAETARGMNETARKESETDRATAESGRVEQETARQKAETDRSTSENARVSAETARTDAEKSRVSAEAERNTAEDTRKTAETGRGTAETARETAEGERKDAEAARAGAETARAAAEGKRAAAETARTTAETAREAAEAERGVVLQEHIANEENPHKATAAQIGADPAGAAQVVQGNLTAHMTDEAKHVTAAERTAWNGKETPEGAQAKADAAVQELKNNPTLVGGIPIVTTFTPEGGTNGTDYAATIPALRSVSVGMLFMVIPHIASTSMSPRLSINGETGANGAIGLPIGRTHSATSSGTGQYVQSGWLLRGVPVLMKRVDKGYLVIDMTQPDATDIKGVVATMSGGTGLSDVPADSYVVGTGWDSMMTKTPDQVREHIGAAQAEHTHDPASVGGIPVVETFTPDRGTTGVSYAASIESITELKAGLIIAIIPHASSTAGSINFKLNAFPSAPVIRPFSDCATDYISTHESTFFLSDVPVLLEYDGSNWCAICMPKTKAGDLDGIVPVRNGGTGLGNDKGGGNFFVSADGNNPMVRKTPEQVAAILSPYLPKRTCRFVVGTSTAGWTASDCDYLCDGVDDQVEINTAIQALPETGGEIVILDGTYDIAETIAVARPNVTLRGMGGSTVLKNMRDITDFINLTHGSAGIVSIDAVNCRVTEILFDGNRETFTKIYNPCLRINSNNCRCDHCTFVRSSGYGVYALYSRATIAACKFDDTETALYVSGNESAVLNNTIVNCSTGIRINSNYSTVSQNTILSIKTYGIQVVSSFGLIDANIISCNVGVDATCISIENKTNNVVGNTTTLGIVGIYVIGDSCSIVGNHINNATACGVFAEYSISKCLISQNNVRRASYTDQQYSIILADNSNADNLISGNMLLGKDIVIAGGTNNTLTNNKFE